MENICVHDVYRKCDNILGSRLFVRVGRDSAAGIGSAFLLVGYRLAPAGRYVYGDAHKVYGLSRAAFTIRSIIFGSTVGVCMERAVVPGG